MCVCVCFFLCRYTTTDRTNDSGNHNNYHDNHNDTDAINDPAQSIPKKQRYVFYHSKKKPSAISIMHEFA